jgi:hypothetical protein
MTNIIRYANKIIDVGTTENPLSTSVELFTRSSANPNIEKSKGDFEENSLGGNAKFLINDDNNPLVWGLKNLDRVAMIIGGRSQIGTTTFIEQDKPIYSTPSYIKSATLADANEIILQNLQMLNPVKDGLLNGKPMATAFNTLSLNITRDIQRGIRVYTIYADSVLSLGGKTIVEWSK